MGMDIINLNIERLTNSPKDRLERAKSENVSQYGHQNKRFL